MVVVIAVSTLLLMTLAKPCVGMVVVMAVSTLLLLTLAKPCVGVVVVMAASTLLLLTLAKPCVGGGCDGSERCVANDFGQTVCWGWLW